MKVYRSKGELGSLRLQIPKAIGDSMDCISSENYVGFDIKNNHIMLTFDKNTGCELGHSKILNNGNGLYCFTLPMKVVNTFGISAGEIVDFKIIDGNTSLLVFKDGI